MKIIQILFFVFVLLGCEVKKNEVNFEPKVEKLVIPINENYLNSYQVWQSYKESGVNKLIAYNNRKHAFDFFNLDSGKVIRQNELSYEGPNGIGEINSLFYHNQDSIFLYERGKLHIVNDKGSLKKTFALNDYLEDFGKGEPTCNFYFKLNYNPRKNEIPFYLIYANKNQEAKGDLPLIGLFNIKKESVEILPVYHDDFFKKNSGQVGFITYMGFYGFQNDGLLYNFQYSSRLFFLNKDGSFIKSKEFNNILPLNNQGEIENHAIENTHFLTPIYDQWNDLIYRFNWDAPLAKNLSGGFIEKETSLDIYNIELEHQYHFTLPSYTYQINNWLVNENGLYLNVAHPKNMKVSEDELVFRVYKFGK